MIEVLFAIFLVSGLFKSVFLALGIWIPVDFTLLSGAVALVVTLWQSFRSGMLSSKILSKENERNWIIILLFYIWILLSLLYTPSAKYAYVKAFLFTTNLVAIAIPLIAPQFNLRMFAASVVGLLLPFSALYWLLAPDVMVERSFRFNSLNMEHLQSYALSLGTTLGVAIILAVWAIRKNTYKLLVINFFLLVLFSTAARAAFIFTIVVLLIYAVFYIRQQKIVLFSKRNQGAFLTLILFNAFIFLLIQTDPYIQYSFQRSLFRYGVAAKSFDTESNKESIAYYLEMKRQGKADGPIEDQPMEDEQIMNMSIIARIDHYWFAAEKSVESLKSFIAGYGFGSYGIIRTERDVRHYPHNVPLEIMFELGIIGLLLFGLFIYRVIKNIRFENVVLAFCLFYLFLNYLKSYSLIDIRLFFGLCAIILFVHSYYHHRFNAPPAK